jgi:hypothetical protein
MGWEFRIVNNKYDRENFTEIVDFYTIHEVYIDDISGKIVEIEKRPYAIVENKLETLKECVLKLQDCLDKPVIKFANGKEY